MKLPEFKLNWISIMFLIFILFICMSLYNYSYNVERKVESMINQASKEKADFNAM